MTLNYTVMNDPDHKCDLPDPAKFSAGTWIKCNALRNQNGNTERCGAKWNRSTKFWSKRPYWEPLSGWGL